MTKSPSGRVRPPSSPFEPMGLGGLRLENRLVALPVYTGYARPDGSVSEPMIDHYALLARSGAALVLVANAAVSEEGVVSRSNLRIDRDGFLPGLTRLARAIHDRGALAGIQLNHAGRFARTDRARLPSPLDTSQLSFNLASLKDFMHFFPFEERFGLTRDFLRMINGWKQGMGEAAVRETVDAFGAAAARAVEAGFDVVEIHGAGGYLVSQFLSPFTNSAPSPWGGGFTARTRFALALVDAVRGRIPEGCPLGFRLMLKEWVPGGVDLPEALALARLLEKAGVDYLSPSVASYNSMFAPPTARRMARPAYLREEMAELGSAVSVPTVISGRVLTPGLAAGLLRDGVADLVGLGRPLRTDPDWIRKARSGKGRVVACTNCNDCIKRVVLDRGFSCTRWPRWVQEKADLGCRLVRRNFDGLWIAASPGDLGRYREWLPRLTRAGSSVPAALLTLERLVSASGMAEATRRFREWAGRTLPEAALSTESLSPPDDTVGLPVDRLLHREIHGSGRGLILLCRQRKPGLGWGERLLYRERGKVVGLIGPGGCRRVLVPVDLSTGTLLTLAFLDHFRWVDRCASLRFVHVQDDPRRPVRARWAEIGRILGADPLPELEVVDPEGGVAETLVRLAAAGDVDTVVMGKRGLSGIKRWILGSVSAAVLRDPGDTTLFFVD